MTFRLADALPASVLQKLAENSVSQADQQDRIAELLDSGLGSCLLHDAENAQIVEQALLHYDGERYRLLAWCVMPNHVHVRLETMDGHPMGSVVQGWKSFTAYRINQRLGRQGVLWQSDYYDRYARNDEQLQLFIAYVEQNPVSAGLVAQARDWRYSSARRRED